MRFSLILILVIGFTGLVFADSAVDYHSVRGRQPLPVASWQRIEAESGYFPDWKKEWLGKWSGGTQITWAGVENDRGKVIFKVAEAGQYRVRLGLNAAPDYGYFTIRLNGSVIAENIDLYSNRVEALSLLDGGVFDLKEGNHTVSFTLVGANAKSKEIFSPKEGDLEKVDDGIYKMGFDFIELGKVSTTQSEPIKAIPVTPSTLAAAKPEVPVYTFAEMKSVFAEHCYGCHGEDKVKGKVNLQELTTIDQFLENIELTKLVSESIGFREMPPEDEPPLPDNVHSRALATIDSWLAKYLEGQSKLPAVTMRRMNRYEYSNAVRDLLSLRGDVYPLPEKAVRSEIPYFKPKTGKFPESIKLGNRPLGKRQVEEPYLSGVVPFSIDLQAEHGFNNRGDELSVSPILMESFLNLANSILQAPEFDKYCKKTPTLFQSPNTSALDEQIEYGNEQLQQLMRKAFRSPVSEESLSRYQNYFATQLKSGATFKQAMKKTVAGVLASPRFIYIVERQEHDRAIPLDAYELATRLSFFLWSTIPDESLLQAAESGEILTDEGLAKQVTRMLESPKSQAVSHNFARQWMRLDMLINSIPDFDRFKHYYSKFGCEQFRFGLHAMAEPLLLFESIMVEDRSIMLLVDSDHTWRTDSMQTWYSPVGTPFQGKGENRFETYQSVYRKTKLNTRREGGVMTTSAVLTMTSDPLRTNPINRGAWVLTVMFNQPPPPPPDAVPEIEADDAAFEAKGMTLRQRLKQHQENESCASCHSKIDPLGFAFENFDAVGRWRDTYRSGLPIDASGDLFGEGDFTDVVGFKDAMLERPELFMRGFTEHFLSYALGRRLELSDKPAVDQMIQSIMADRGQFSTVVHEIVKSYPFRHKSQHIIQSSHSHHDSKE